MSDLLHTCMNCGDSFDPEYSFLDHICSFCYYPESADRNELNEDESHDD